jgi:ribosome maturation factor RimP
MDNLTQDIKDVCESVGVAFYDTETAQDGYDAVFRIYITAIDGNGINVDQCAHVSRLLSPMFDVTPPITGIYRLEVSSPGIERKLSNPAHYLGSVGEKVKVVMNDGQVFRGPLLSATDDLIVINDTDTEVEVPLNEIKRASTYFEW